MLQRTKDSGWTCLLGEGHGKQRHECLVLRDLGRKLPFPKGHDRLLPRVAADDQPALGREVEDVEERTSLLEARDALLQVSSQGPLPSDVVFSPFAGIGSELYQAILMKRYAIGIELKESYYVQAVSNCKNAEIERQQLTIDDFISLDKAKNQERVSHG